MKTAKGTTLLFVPSLLTVLLLGLTGCDAFSSDDEDTSGIVTLTGQVINQSTNNPVPGAIVRVLPFDLVFEADEEGKYLFDVEIDSTMDLRVRATAAGFSEETLTILGLAGRTIEVPTIRVFPFVEEEQDSGKASNILLLDQSASSIGVKESGSEEVADLTFQLADSSGKPVVLDKKVLVSFRFGVQPGGGEFLSPARAETDNNGIATVHLSSGTRSGVVQVIAETTVDGTTIRSQPVAVTIHGGLPDQSHFTLGPVRRNFPGLNQFGIINAMSVIVGDKYSNPVRTGSAVYFSSTHGVVEGSTLTDAQGRGTVDLISANPLPPDGIAHITATTANDQQLSVSATTPVVFSGFPVFTISPGAARRNQTYSLSLADQNGNPLVAGTSISIAAEGTAVKAVGATSVRLNDTAFSGGSDYEHVVRGPGVTEFTFRVIDDVDPSNPQTPIVEAVTISISSENGNLDIVLDPGGAPSVQTDGASVERTGEGSYRISVPDEQL